MMTSHIPWHTRLCFVCLLLSSCTEGPTQPNRQGPVPCFEQRLFRILSPCPERYEFSLDASCATDGQSDFPGLSVRWDFENDGVWDTTFGPSDERTLFRPTSFPDVMWEARAELQDADGNAATLVQSIDLSDVLPGDPDLIAGDLVVWQPAGTEVDTVVAGVGFWVGIHETCWVRTPVSGVATQYYLNSEPWFAGTHTCQFQATSCSFFGRLGLVIDEPGVYEVSVALDADGVVAETDETNNTSRMTLYVVPSNPRLQRTGRFCHPTRKGN